MGHFTKKETETMLADRSYWRAFAPPGWGLVGWTYRHGASFSHEDGRFVEIDANQVAFINDVRANEK